MSASAVYKKNPAIIEREIRGEVLLVPLMNSEENLESLYSLNETGAFIWKEICAGSSIAQTAERLAAVFDVSPEQAAADVSSVVDDLVCINALMPPEN